MANALTMTGGEKAQETAKFVRMFDKFFDSLNVNSYNAGRLKRKVFKQPYRSAKDFRLRVCRLQVYQYSYIYMIATNVRYF